MSFQIFLSTKAEVVNVAIVNLCTNDNAHPS